MTKSAKRKAHDAHAAQQNVHRARQQYDRLHPAPDNRPYLHSLPQAPLAAPFAPVEINRADFDSLLFGANSGYTFVLMPAMDSIPEEFTVRHGKYHDLVMQWFFHGLAKFEPTPRDSSIDPIVALRHLTVIMRSFEPSHEHKMASVRFLIDTWFSDVKWESK